ncbi:MAG: tRNA pseudouridine(38-40) synthase TruA [Flavobacteriales bacterium]
MKYFIEFSFNGTNYHGWQKQLNANTVQEELTKCLSVLLKEEVELMGASRTDTGVHAKQMFAHLDTSTILNSDKIVTKLNSFLPNDIMVSGLFPVKEDTHVRFTAVARTYKYYVSPQKDIFNNNLHLVFKHLDIDKMNAACTYLMGEQDFTSFSKVNTDTFTNNCNITKAVWEKEGDTFVFTISANRFLRNMVRSIVGTLLDVGIGKIEVEEIKTIIEKKDRCDAGTSVPAKALFLTEIKYPKDI